MNKTLSCSQRASEMSTWVIGLVLQKRNVSNLQFTSRLFSSPLLNLIPPSPRPLPMFAITSEKFTSLINRIHDRPHCGKFNACYDFQAFGAIVLHQKNLQYNLGLGTRVYCAVFSESLSAKWDCKTSSSAVRGTRRHQPNVCNL